MKLTNNKLKQLINEVLEEASEKAPFGPFTDSKSYVKSQRAAKLAPGQPSKLADLDKSNPEMSRVMDQSLGIDNPESDIKIPIEILKRQQEFRDIIANQSMGAFSEKGADPATKVSTRAIGDAYKIGTWTRDRYVDGGVFANKTGIYVLDNDGRESYFTPKGPPDPGEKGYKLIPITKKFNEQIFMNMFEGRKR